MRKILKHLVKSTSNMNNSTIPSIFIVQNIKLKLMVDFIGLSSLPQKTYGDQ